jgi:hypothetical protein
MSNHFNALRQVVLDIFGEGVNVGYVKFEGNFRIQSLHVHCEAIGHFILLDDMFFQIAWNFATFNWQSLFLPSLCMLNLIFQMILHILQKGTILDPVNIFAIVSRF